MPTALYTRWELASESGKFKPRRVKTSSYENMVMSYCQRVKSQCNVEFFHTIGTKKNWMHTVLMAFCGHCNTVFTAMGCYRLYCPRHEACASPTEQENWRDIRNGELDALRKQYIQEKSYEVIEMYECDLWKIYKTDNFVIQHLRESCPYKMPLTEERLLQKKQIWKSIWLCSM